MSDFRDEIYQHRNLVRKVLNRAIADWYTAALRQRSDFAKSFECCVNRFGIPPSIEHLLGITARDLGLLK